MSPSKKQVSTVGVPNDLKSLELALSEAENECRALEFIVHFSLGNNPELPRMRERLSRRLEDRRLLRLALSDLKTREGLALSRLALNAAPELPSSSSSQAKTFRSVHRVTTHRTRDSRGVASGKTPYNVRRCHKCLVKNWTPQHVCDSQP